MRYGYQLVKVTDNVFAFFGRVPGENKGGLLDEVARHMLTLGFDVEDVELGFVALDSSCNVAEYGVLKSFIYAKQLKVTQNVGPKVSHDN